jgi:CheY-like chemotaxis protein
MVVDDNIDAASMLGMLLEASGHQVTVEHESLRALERARRELPDACLLDIGLPEMDGNELARRLRSDAVTAGIVLIAVTGYGQEQDRRDAFEAGFAHHLVKPVDMARLAGVLAGVRSAD